MNAVEPRCARSDGVAIRSLLRSLRGLAEVDARIFRLQPDQHELYFVALRNTIAASQGGARYPWRFVYARERETCGKSNCWNTWAELVEVCGPWGPVRADCKALAAAHAAANLVRDPSREWFVGIRAGCHVGHAVAGVREGKAVRIMDPCIAAGMEPLSNYDGFFWERVRRR